MQFASQQMMMMPPAGPSQPGQSQMGYMLYMVPEESAQHMQTGRPTMQGGMPGLNVQGATIISNGQLPPGAVPFSQNGHVPIIVPGANGVQQQMVVPQQAFQQFTKPIVETVTDVAPGRADRDPNWRLLQPEQPARHSRSDEENWRAARLPEVNTYFLPRFSAPIASGKVVDVQQNERSAVIGGA